MLRTVSLAVEINPSVLSNSRCVVGSDRRLLGPISMACSPVALRGDPDFAWKGMSMKTWKWTHTALSLLVLGLMTMTVGCEDKTAVTPANGPAPTVTPPAADGAPAQPEAGSAIGGGVDVPPPAATEKPAEATEKPAETTEEPAKPEEGKKEEADKPAEEKPAEEKPAEEKPAEEKKAE